MAIGGGVCLDVTGLAANLYRRNTPVIKVHSSPLKNRAVNQHRRNTLVNRAFSVLRTQLIEVCH